MQQHLSMKMRQCILIMGLTALALATPARAQEYCVSCAEPNATYRCVITDPKPGAGQSLQVACTGALARDGKHNQCSIKSGVTVFECDAPIKRVALGDLKSAPVVVQPAAPPVPDPNAPPTTLLEAAKRAKAASDQNLKKQADSVDAAADATGNFVLKSLKCIGTLFTQCK
jgi:hypothetical protein